MASRFAYFALIALIIVVALPSPAAAFGAGNIASVSQIEGQNFRHGVSPLPRRSTGFRTDEDMAGH